MWWLAMMAAVCLGLCSLSLGGFLLMYLMGCPTCPGLRRYCLCRRTK